MLPSEVETCQSQHIAIRIALCQSYTLPQRAFKLVVSFRSLDVRRLGGPRLRFSSQQWDREARTNRCLAYDLLISLSIRHLA